jgi:hypothetical protein
MPGILSSSNCRGTPQGKGGCQVDDQRDDSFGKKFNDEKGGVYSVEWTSDYIRVFFFPSAIIPAGDNGLLGYVRLCHLFLKANPFEHLSGNST